MSETRNLYTNEQWHAFAGKVKARDGWQCVKCQRTEQQVVLQVHHETYIANRKPWEYVISDCITLCKGCHARSHGLIEPNRGWFLLAIDDLGGSEGVCERAGCGNEIRYEHLTYHPEWGYKVVGSTCIEHLTQRDKELSGKLLACYRNISKFVHTSTWRGGTTKKGKEYIGTKHSHHLIRIYGSEGSYAFQLALKRKGRRIHDYGSIVSIPGKSLDDAKELAYITLKGTTSDDEDEIEMLRRLYRSVR